MEHLLLLDRENEFVDNTAENIKIGTALHYRLNDKIEAIAQFNAGLGNTVYTANDRFILDDLSIWTGKLELRGSNFSVRAIQLKKTLETHTLRIL